MTDNHAECVKQRFVSLKSKLKTCGTIFKKRIDSKHYHEGYKMSLKKNYTRMRGLLVAILMLIGIGSIGLESSEKSARQSDFSEVTREMNGAPIKGLVRRFDSKPSASRLIIADSGVREIEAFFPETFDKPFIVESNGVRVGLKTIGANPSRVEVEQDQIIYREAFEETDSRHTVEQGRSEEFLYLRSESAPRSFEYELTEIAGTDSIELKSGAIVFSRAGRDLLQIEAPWVIDATGRRSDDAVRWELDPDRGDGTRQLRLLLDASGLRYPLTIDPTWSSTGPLPDNTIETSLAFIPTNSTVLMAGGYLPSYLNKTRIFDPITQTWAAGPNLTNTRSYPTATYIPSIQQVIVVGGYRGSSVNDVDFYNPATNTIAVADPLPGNRHHHTATLLSNDTVLIAGGYQNTSTVTTAYVYSAATTLWTSSTMVSAAGRHTATLLSNGKVLVVGGTSQSNTAQLYDLTPNTWASTTNPPGFHGDQGHTATLMSDGRVLVVGGEYSGTLYKNADIYDPTTGTWTTTGQLNMARSYHTAHLLPNGKVLVIGGGGSGTNTTTELYDPTTGTWSNDGALPASMGNIHRSILFPSGPLQGRILATGVGTASILSANCPTVTLTPAALDGALAGTSYSATVTASPAGTYTYSVLSGSLPPGLTLNASTGAITGTATTAGLYSFTIQAADSDGCTGSQAYSMLARAMTVQIPNVQTTYLPGASAQIVATLTNHAANSQSASYTGTLPSGLVPVPGSCTASVGSCSFSGSSPATLNWSGTLTAGQTVTITYKVQVTNQVANTANLCVASTGTIGGLNAGNTSNCINVLYVPPGPGSLVPVASEAGDQKAGSVLIFNLYTSSAATANQNTQINITNVSFTDNAYVHLFFVDGSTCSVADQYLTLTPNQTTTFYTSDFDPGTTGYIIGVATNTSGCPINFNNLIGDAYITFESGHSANLGAYAVTAISGGLQNCEPTMATSTLTFDGVSYNRLPRAVAVDNINSRASGNNTMLVLNRLGGNLLSSADKLSAIFGLLYDDQTTSQSFTISGGTCQLVGTLSNSFPRTSPRFDSVVAAGRTGWMKLWHQDDLAISGAVINYQPNGNSRLGGHNLHVLTLASSVTMTIPVFPVR